MAEEWARVAWPAAEGADTGECTGDPSVMGSMLSLSLTEPMVCSRIGILSQIFRMSDVARSWGCFPTLRSLAEGGDRVLEVRPVPG